MCHLEWVQGNAKSEDDEEEEGEEGGEEGEEEEKKEKGGGNGQDTEIRGGGLHIGDGELRRRFLTFTTGTKY